MKQIVRDFAKEKKIYDDINSFKIMACHCFINILFFQDEKKKWKLVSFTRSTDRWPCWERALYIIHKSREGEFQRFLGSVSKAMPGRWWCNKGNLDNDWDIGKHNNNVLRQAIKVVGRKLLHVCNQTRPTFRSSSRDDEHEICGTHVAAAFFGFSLYVLSQQQAHKNGS